MKLLQARADIARVIGTDATLFRADVDQEIVDGRVALDTVFASELARHSVSGHRQELGLLWVDIAWCERHQRVTQSID